jgi:hypothetical protein
MGTQTSTKLDRRRREIAASYRKQGYRVTAPSVADALPSFLRDCHPDLIAEKEGDRVVIEVKPSHALKGANDLIELADRVAAEPGWRLELVTVRSEPEYRELLAPEWLEHMLHAPSPGTEVGYRCIYLGEVLAYLIRGMASVNNIRLRDKTTLHLARELVYAGAFDQDLLDRIEDAFAWQDQMMRRTPAPRSASQQAAELEQLCRDLHVQVQDPED